MALLYIETNYLMGVATGRYPIVADLLHALTQETSLCLPACCIIEAFAALEGEQARRNALTPTLDEQIWQLRSGVKSVLVQAILGQLEQLKLDNQKLINEFQDNLINTLDAILARATLINLTNEEISQSLGKPYCDQLTDNLILHTIPAYAASREDKPQAFFTANAADFSSADARSALNAAGVMSVIKTYEDLTQWLAAVDVG